MAERRPRRADVLSVQIQLAGMIGCVEDGGQGAGVTHDAGVNAQHLDLIQLTAKKLTELGARIRVVGTIDRRSRKDLASLIGQSVAHGFVNPNQLAPDIRKHVVS